MPGLMMSRPRNLMKPMKNTRTITNDPRSACDIHS
jgi:hypothetical protein